MTQLPFVSPLLKYVSGGGGYGGMLPFGKIKHGPVWPTLGVSYGRGQGPVFIQGGVRDGRQFDNLYSTKAPSSSVFERSLARMPETSRATLSSLWASVRSLSFWRSATFAIAFAILSSLWASHRDLHNWNLQNLTWHLFFQRPP